MTLSVRGLAKSYGAVEAVKGVSFDVGAGEVYGLLGRNGAGKTTTLESVLGLIEPDAGAVVVCGVDARRDPRSARRKVGAVLQGGGLQDEITPREAVRLFGSLHGVDVDAAAALGRVGLGGKADARYASLSGGQKQRLALALAFLSDPKLVVLDEPGAGLDPEMRRELHERIRAMRSEGRAVLLATHDLDEAEQLCDRVGIIEAGCIVREGPPRALIADVEGAALVRIDTDRPVDPVWLEETGPLERPVCGPAGLRFATADLDAALARVLAILGARGVRITGVRAGKATLEDVILDESEPRP